MADVNSDDDAAEEGAQIMPTPMALRDISNKAQQALASLYSDSPDTTHQSLANLCSVSPDNEGLSTDPMTCFSAKKLFQDEDESEDITN